MKIKKQELPKKMKDLGYGFKDYPFQPVDLTIEIKIVASDFDCLLNMVNFQGLSTSKILYRETYEIFINNIVIQPVFNIYYIVSSKPEILFHQDVNLSSFFHTHLTSQLAECVKACQEGDIYPGFKVMDLKKRFGSNLTENGFRSLTQLSEVNELFFLNIINKSAIIANDYYTRAKRESPLYKVGNILNGKKMKSSKVSAPLYT